MHRKQSINTQSKKKKKKERGTKSAVTPLMTRIELSKLSVPLQEASKDFGGLLNVIMNAVTLEVHIKQHLKKKKTSL